MINFNNGCSIVFLKIQLPHILYRGLKYSLLMIIICFGEKSIIGDFCLIFQMNCVFKIENDIFANIIDLPVSTEEPRNSMKKRPFLLMFWFRKLSPYICDYRVAFSHTTVDIELSSLHPILVGIMLGIVAMTCFSLLYASDVLATPWFLTKGKDFMGLA